VTLEVSEDREAVGERVRGLIESYNAVVNFVNARSQYDFEKNSGDPLYAEGTVQSLLLGMSRIVTSGVAGLPSELKSLSQIGVKTNRDGTLSLDEAKLQKALDENLGGVEDLFVQNGTTAGVGEQLYQLAYRATRSEDGSLSIRTAGLQEGIRNLGRKIEDQEAALDRYEVRLRAQFAALESLLSSYQSQEQYLTGIANAAK
jgi:flagellar hook-associated protein 2